MSRVAQALKSKLIILPLVVILAAAAYGGDVLLSDKSQPSAQTVTNANHQITQISYHGENGVNALKLLDEKAKVQSKHYSFGDLVTAIDGVSGNGPKYWIFYVNNKEASVGAGSYITKSSDVITWKLQKL
jgi:hypothetical protein